ncbi:MAG: isoleucine--tRNA ligase [Panacagrimonas sp.]
MQANLARREPEFLKRWEAEGLYRRIGEQTAGRPTWRLVDGPPYANGDIHIGHAVNKVLKDIIVKSRRLDGYHAPFVPGWDCHGLPIELQVEKKHGKVGVKQDAARFRARCREYAGKQVERQRLDFKRLGVLAEWEKPYLTMDPLFEAEQLRALSQIVGNGHVVRGFKPVHWCLDCGSSLAEAEVEYEDKQSHAIDVAFAAAQADDVAACFGIGETVPASFVIWTTTPWTLPGNQAIAVNAELKYSLVEAKGSEGARYLILASELVPAVLKRSALELTRTLGECDGAQLKGLRAQHPFAAREVPVICGDHVSLEAGTGLVHTAPAHGVEDYQAANAARAEGIELSFDNPVASNGCFVSGTPVVEGLFVRKADEPILETLRDKGALLCDGKISHSFPHCWRHKTPLIFRATPQWFVSMDAKGLRDGALDAIAQTQWIPGWGEARIREMVAGRPDWCISRQRYWGVPMAVFVHREHQTLHPDTGALLAKIADRVEQDGLEAWFASSPGDWGVDDTEYEKCPDTLDVWFDSGVAHQCAFKSVEPEALEGGVAPQMDLYLEGSDQHRGWFQSSLLTSVAMYGRAPYRSVLTHGFTVDEQGRKMSKSLGNVVAPQEVTKTLGADVLRLWVAASDYSGEIAISKSLLDRTADAYRRIRNTVRYLLGNLNGFDPQTDLVAADQLLAIDRWALSEASKVQSELKRGYETSAFHLVYQRLHNYCSVDLGGGYLDILKDRLYTTASDSLARRSAQTVLFHLAEAMVRWIAPILSFTADEIWNLLPGDRTQPVFAQTWYDLPAVKADDVDWNRLLRVRDAVRKSLENRRSRGEIGSGLNAEVMLFADGDWFDALHQLGAELRFWFITSDAHVGHASLAPEQAEVFELEGGDSIKLVTSVSQHERCVRCWHQRADVGAHLEHPSLCSRCVDNVDGDGETRQLI